MFRVIAFALGAVLAACGDRGPPEPQPPEPPAPSVPSRLIRISGNNQAAPVGKAVSNDPVVKVLNQYGRGLGGVAVRCVVGTSGASISPGMIQTNTAGEASCSGWTLGPARGINLLEVSVEGLAPVSFAAVGFIGSESITVDILDPAAGFAATRVAVRATASSFFPIASVVATVGMVAAPLTTEAGPGPCAPGEPCDPFKGALDLSAQPRGVLM